MKAIVVRYIGPSNLKGSRVKASAEGVPSITRSYDHAENDGGKRAVAQELADKYGWRGELIEGSLPNGDIVFVFSGNLKEALRDLLTLAVSPPEVQKELSWVIDKARAALR